LGAGGPQFESGRPDFGSLAVAMGYGEAFFVKYRTQRGGSPYLRAFAYKRYDLLPLRHYFLVMVHWQDGPCDEMNEVDTVEGKPSSPH
jgi:hypothetical protein